MATSDIKGLSIDENQWLSGTGNPNWEPTPERQAELAKMGYTPPAKQKPLQPINSNGQLPEGALGWYNDPNSPYHGQPVFPQNQPDSQGRTGYIVKGFNTSSANYSDNYYAANDAPPPISQTPPTAANQFGSTYTPQASATQPAQSSASTNLTGNETSGSVAATQTTTSQTTSQPTSQPTTQPTQTQLTPEQQAAQAANQQKLDQLLANPNLTADQKAAIQAIYGAVSNNDMAQADKIKAAIAAGTQYSDPYFKAQTRLVLDALDRSFQAADDDLAFKENSLQKSLQALIQDITASKDYLSFQEQMELKALQRNMEQQIDTTQQDMAARGFSSSSIRSRAEGLINETYTDMRESTSRSFLEQGNALDRNLATQQQTTQDQIAYYRNLAAQSKTDALRAAEQQVGTTGLQNAGYTDNLVGGVGGAIPEAQTKDSLAFASQFAF